MRVSCVRRNSGNNLGESVVSTAQGNASCQYGREGMMGESEMGGARYGGACT